MLVITRKSGEAILIGKNIRIVIERIDRDRVKIGIDAPQEVRVLRDELEGRNPVEGYGKFPNPIKQNAEDVDLGGES